MSCALLLPENLRMTFGTCGTLCYRKLADNDVPKDPFFTGHSLLTHSQEKEKSFKPNSRPGNCVYCDVKKHISSRCNVVTYVETRKNIKKSR